MTTLQEKFVYALEAEAEAYDAEAKAQGKDICEIAQNSRKAAMRAQNSDSREWEKFPNVQRCVLRAQKGQSNARKQAERIRAKVADEEWLSSMESSFRSLFREKFMKELDWPDARNFALAWFNKEKENLAKYWDKTAEAFGEVIKKTGEGIP